MLERVLARFREVADAAGEDESDLAFAAAALFAEVAWSDHELSDDERTEMRTLLTEQFGLDDDAVNTLVDRGLKEHSESVGLHAFTRALTDNWPEQTRYELVVRLWRLAYCDHHIDKYEEHTIRRIAELLYLSHARFIQAKHQARDQER